jgi:hypothetical protein
MLYNKVFLIRSDACYRIGSRKTALNTTTIDNIVITATDTAGNATTQNVTITATNKSLITISSDKPNGANNTFTLTG